MYTALYNPDSVVCSSWTADCADDLKWVVYDTSSLTESTSDLLQTESANFNDIKLELTNTNTKQCVTVMRLNNGIKVQVIGCDDDTHFALCQHACPTTPIGD